MIGTHEFTDGVTRPVVEDDGGQQWVTGPDGEPVYGNWIPIEALVELTPIVVQADGEP